MTTWTHRCASTGPSGVTEGGFPGLVRTSCPPGPPPVVNEGARKQLEPTLVRESSPVPQTEVLGSPGGRSGGGRLRPQGLPHRFRSRPGKRRHSPGSQGRPPPLLCRESLLGGGLCTIPRVARVLVKLRGVGRALLPSSHVQGSLRCAG